MLSNRKWCCMREKWTLRFCWVFGVCFENRKGGNCVCFVCKQICYSLSTGPSCRVQVFESSIYRFNIEFQKLRLQCIATSGIVQMLVHWQKNVYTSLLGTAPYNDNGYFIKWRKTRLNVLLVATAWQDCRVLTNVDSWKLRRILLIKSEQKKMHFCVIRLVVKSPCKTFQRKSARIAKTWHFLTQL